MVRQTSESNDKILKEKVSSDEKLDLSQDNIWIPMNVRNPYEEEMENSVRILSLLKSAKGETLDPILDDERIKANTQPKYASMNEITEPNYSKIKTKSEVSPAMVNRLQENPKNLKNDRIPNDSGAVENYINDNKKLTKVKGNVNLTKSVSTNNLTKPNYMAVKHIDCANLKLSKPVLTSLTELDDIVHPDTKTPKNKYFLSKFGIPKSKSFARFQFQDLAANKTQY